MSKGRRTHARLVNSLTDRLQLLNVRWSCRTPAVWIGAVSSVTKDGRAGREAEIRGVFAAALGRGRALTADAHSVRPVFQNDSIRAGVSLDDPQ